VKICMLTGAFPPDRCGVGDYVQRLCSHLAELGAEVHVVTTAHAEPQPAEWDGTVGVHRIMRKWNSAGMCRLSRLIREIRPDVVHVQFPSVGYHRVAALALLPLYLRAHGRRSILTLHEYLISSRLSRIRQAMMAAASHAVITVTPEDEARLRLALPWKQQSVHCISIASNIDRQPGESFDRTSCRKAWGMEPDAPVICFFGNLHPGKGVEELIDAFAALSRTCEGARLLLIGSFDPRHTLYSYVVHRKILDLNLSGSVRVTGFVSRREVSELLLSSDICVLPFREGVSVRRGTFLAAMRHGLPIITTQPAGAAPPELVDGGNVLLVGPQDTAGLARCMEMLVRSPELRSRLALNVAELDSRFSWPEIARRTLAVYDAAPGNQ